ncbi:MAG TPA: hypothetical protein DEG72_10680 [Hyphomonas sp.]|nr:hypothetical protein [Hyphomonas sp.]
MVADGEQQTSDNGVSVYMVTTKTGDNIVFAFAEDTSAELKHVIDIDGISVEWTGPVYAYIQSST